jgi:copper chaperone
VTAQVFEVTGMTCDHCVHAVTEEIQALAGVRFVDVDLDAGGTSVVTVEADRTLTESEVSDALDEAGAYELA